MLSSKQYKHADKILTVTPKGIKWARQAIKDPSMRGSLQLDIIRWFSEFYDCHGPVIDYYNDSEDVTMLANGAIQRAIDTLVRKGYVKLT